MRKQCKDCALWQGDNSGDSWCPMKPLYTHTDGNRECDETDIRGEKYFTPKKRKDSFDDTL